MDDANSQPLQLDSFLLSLSERGVELWAEDDHLRYSAPVGTLRRGDIAILREHKAALLGLLSEKHRGISIPLVPRGTSEPIPLTAQQHRFWKVVIAQGNRSFRECVVAMRIQGNLDVSRLGRSIEGLVHRHEALRTRIVVTNGIPMQHVDEGRRYRLDVVDLTLAADPEAETKGRAREFLLEELDLSVDPLFAAQLFRWPSHVSVLVLAFDHLISDAVSMEICSNEIWRFYDSALEDVSAEVLGPTLQFGDYAMWQHRSYDQWLRFSGDYWRSHLRDAPQIRIPHDPPAGVEHDATIATCYFLLGGAGSVQLRRIARHEGAPLSVVVLAIYVAAASEWLGQRDLTLISVWSARGRPELEGMVGFIATALYLRISVPEVPDLRGLTQVANRELCTAMEHQDFDRAPGLVPNCHTDLQFNWATGDGNPSLSAEKETSKNDLSVEPFPIERARPIKFSSSFVETTDGVVACLSYGRDQFLESTVHRFGIVLQRYAESLK